jgi:uncharacterized UBP type Zn finger protein
MNSLVEMGFPKAKAELALLETGNSNVEVAIEWLLQVRRLPLPAVVEYMSSIVKH